MRYLFGSLSAALTLDELMGAACDWAMEAWCPEKLLGADFAGFLTTDRWSAYEWVNAGLRQLCWAHLTRDFQGFIDRGGRGGRIDRELMRECNRFFKWYYRVRDGTMTREHLEKRMRGVERRIGQQLREAARRAEKKTAGMAREILQWEKCLWTFVDVPDLEPSLAAHRRGLRGPSLLPTAPISQLALTA
jgi:transposase